MQVFDRKGKSSGDRLVTKVFPLVYESATQLVATLRPLVSANNFMAAYQGANTLVITDYADNVARISRDRREHRPAASRRRADHPDQIRFGA